MSSSDAPSNSQEHVTPQLDWRPFDTAPRDGRAFYVRIRVPMRFKLYKPNSAQFQKGLRGRWQSMNEYGGWDNCPEPDGLEWSPHPKDLERDGSSPQSPQPTEHTTDDRC